MEHSPVLKFNRETPKVTRGLPQASIAKKTEKFRNAVQKTKLKNVGRKKRVQKQKKKSETSL